MAEESTEVMGGNIGMLAQLSSAEIDTQIATARRYPRDLDRFRKNVEKQITFDEDSAKSMTYSLERSEYNKETGKSTKKQIPGPSVRFAEVVAVNYGNLRVGARIVDIDNYHTTAQGMAWDLENNFAAFRERKGRITKSNGQRYSEDMIVVASNAASSIAYREAILKTIPKYLWHPLWLKVGQFLLPDQSAAIKQRDKALDFWKSKGISLETILFKLGHAAIEEINSEDILTMGGWYVQVRDGASPASIFEDKPAEGKPAPEGSTMAEKVKHNTAGLNPEAKAAPAAADKVPPAAAAAAEVLGGKVEGTTSAAQREAEIVEAATKAGNEKSSQASLLSGPPPRK